MDKLNLNKRVYSKNQYEKVIDTKFSQLVSPVANIPTDTNNVTSDISVEQFFQYYNQLFFQIPKFGPNSHETLIKQSSDYVGGTILNDEIQALIDEINLLQSQNLELNQQLVNLQVSSSQQI